MSGAGLRPCQKSGKHKVVNIVPLGKDIEDKYLAKEGYRFRGTCSLCDGSIVAKDKKEYEDG